MTLLNPLTSLTSLVFATLALQAKALVKTTDISGYANILVLNSTDWQTASPSQQVGDRKSVV